MFLTQLPKDKFDYDYWVGKNWGGKSNLSCGTKACALGWATTIPEFKRAGLKLSGRRDNGFVEHRPSRTTNTEAGMRVFELTRAEAAALFLGDLLYSRNGMVLLEDIRQVNPTAKQIGKRIRLFVKLRE